MSLSTASVPPPGVLSGSPSIGAGGEGQESSGREKEGEADPLSHQVVQEYASPLQRLVAVARDGKVGSVQSESTALLARTIRLTNIAESAAGALKHDPKLVK